MLTQFSYLGTGPGGDPSGGIIPPTTDVSRALSTKLVEAFSFLNMLFPQLGLTVDLDQLRQLRNQSFKTGAFSDALNYNNSLVARLTSQKGPYDQETMNARAQTAGIYVWLGDFTSARNTYNQVLLDQQRVLGLSHPDTLGTMQAINNLPAWQKNSS